ncbi:glycosyltransferase [Paraferrimonas sp. SM1919]|uniref:glycosyltransferase n=1 Tax=Paraferrimonas sp. SM1919 TaxID=2662263 RepID=UPI0013D7C5D2|nr:glycosyltransferase [Paraferrimonas sp. SM1919]
MKIFYFSLLDWYVTKQRPQHIAEGLSKYYDVTYFNILPFSNKEMRPHKLGDDIGLKSFNSNEGLIVKRIRLLPRGSFFIVKFINEFFLSFYFKYIMKIDNNDVLWFTHPSQVKYIPKSFNGITVYDCMDKYDQFTSDESIIKKNNYDEINLVKVADVVFSSSKSLAKHLKGIGAKQVTVINNAATFDRFNIDKAEVMAPSDINVNRKIVGYFGGVGSWFDVNLLINLASRLPDVDFLIIGPVSCVSIKEKCQSHTNIYFLGPKNFEELPSYLANFDVCILPFITNELIKYVDPVKVYEYLSSGKPVVVPKYDEIMKFADYLYVSENDDDFYEKVKLSLDEEGERLPKKRKEFSFNNTWVNRVEDIRLVIEKAVRV